MTSTDPDKNIAPNDTKLSPNERIDARGEISRVPEPGLRTPIPDYAVSNLSPRFLPENGLRE
jgi:hypothetical protein